MCLPHLEASNNTKFTIYKCFAQIAWQDGGDVAMQPSVIAHRVKTKINFTKSILKVTDILKTFRNEIIK